ncbi:MAG TPA: hypothetical protein VF701_06515 [Thermoanaerobaculia bacterium]
MSRHSTAIAAFALLLAFTPAAEAADDIVRRSFAVAEGGTLRLDARIGSIKIVTGGDGVAVEVQRRASGLRAEDILAEHRIDFSQSGNDVTISSDFERIRTHWTANYKVQWNIRVPARYNVEVRTSGGGIELANMGGTVDARTSGGRIRTGTLAGRSSLRTSGGSIDVSGASSPLTAHTSGGSITIGDTRGPVDARTSGGSIQLARIAGNVIAKTSGGSIRIDDVAGSVDARTSGGSIQARISGQPSADSHLSTSGGRVKVELNPGVAVDVDARASGGGVRADIPVTVHGKIGKNEVRGQINGGGPKLTLRTSGGGITISRI